MCSQKSRTVKMEGLMDAAMSKENLIKSVRVLINKLEGIHPNWRDCSDCSAIMNRAIGLLKSPRSSKLPFITIKNSLEGLLKKLAVK